MGRKKKSRQARGPKRRKAPAPRRRGAAPGSEAYREAQSAAHPQAGRPVRPVAREEETLPPSLRESAMEGMSVLEAREAHKATLAQDKLYKMIEACVPEATDPRLGLDLKLIQSLPDRAFDSDRRERGLGDMDPDSVPYELSNEAERTVFTQHAVNFFSKRRQYAREVIGPLERAPPSKAADAPADEPPTVLDHPDELHPWAAGVAANEPAVVARWLAVTRDPAYTHAELALPFVVPGSDPLAPMPAQPSPDDLDPELATFDSLEDLAAAVRRALGDTLRIEGVAAATAAEAESAALWVGLAPALALVLWAEQLPASASTAGITLWTVRRRHYVPRAWHCPAAGYPTKLPRAEVEAANLRGDRFLLKKNLREEENTFYQYGMGTDRIPRRLEDALGSF